MSSDYGLKVHGNYGFIFPAILVLSANSPMLSPYFSYKFTGEKIIKISRKFTSGAHILNSRDPGGLHKH